MMNEQNYFELVKSYKLQANKSLGQNFLINPEVASKIVNALDLKEGDKVIEIGAGLGSISYFLAKSPAKSTLIDVDDRMIAFLEEQYKDSSNIVVKRENILKSDLSQYNKIIGNLPYYITTGILETILLKAVNAESIVLMCQKEVYSKLLKNTKDISPLSLFLNFVSNIELVTNVSRNNFAPIPHVDSLVFKLTPNENIRREDNASLYNLMNKLFLHRRKTIYNCLRFIINSNELTSEVLAKVNIKENLRPEQIEIESYIRLLNELKARNLLK